MEVLTLGRRKLAAVVHPSTKMIHDTVVAVLARIGLAAHLKVGVAILVLARGGNHHHTLEVQTALVPSLSHLS